MSDMRITYEKRASRKDPLKITISASDNQHMSARAGAMYRTRVSEEGLAKRARVRAFAARLVPLERAISESAKAKAKAPVRELGQSYSERRKIFWKVVASYGQPIEDSR